MKRKLSKRRQAWCKEYERITGFEALMDDFLEGNHSFRDAVNKSVQWYDDHTRECMASIPQAPQ